MALLLFEFRFGHFSSWGILGLTFVMTFDYIWSVVSFCWCNLSFPGIWALKWKTLVPVGAQGWHSLRWSTPFGLTLWTWTAYRGGPTETIWGKPSHWLRASWAFHSFWTPKVKKTKINTVRDRKHWIFKKCWDTSHIVHVGRQNPKNTPNK